MTKKIFIVLVLAAMTLSISAAKKKKQEPDAITSATTQQADTKKAPCCGRDSLSYAAGYAYTNGLLPYLQQRLNVDTAYMADFIQGMKDARPKAGTPRFNAYVAGEQIANMVKEGMLPGLSTQLKGTADSLNVDEFYEGFYASVSGDTTVFAQEAAENFFQKRMDLIKSRKGEVTKKEGEEWLKANQTKPGVVTTASGLQYKVITLGDGERPKAEDEVEVKYEGRLIDGTVFDSSYKRNPQTTKFKCTQVIKGWTEGLQLMPVGSKYEFYIPQELAYGADGAPGGQIPPYSALVFTVELVGITK